MDNRFDKEARVAKARAYFKAGYNCCQAVAMAYSDVIAGKLGMQSLPAEQAEKAVATLASGFGGGMGRMREVCGCVSGMTMVAGALCSAEDPSDHNARTENYRLVQEFAGAYKDLNGSIICRELLGLDNKKESPEPSLRTPEYYKKRPCEELVGIAAGIIADHVH